MSLLSFLQVLLLGNANDGKARLQKQPTKEDHVKWFEGWVERHFTIICLFVVIFLLIIFITVCFALVGLSATDSGLTYNAMERIV